ncbi:hypothetical protein BDAP_000148 [Binucleata daphniae]
MDNSYAHPIRFGNAFLDCLYANIGPGSLILIKEDEYSYHHKTFVKTFIAQNINNEIIVISKDEKNLNIPDYKKNKTFSNIESDKMLIAWRYQNLEKQNENEMFDMGTKMNLKNKKYSFANEINTFKENSIVCVLSLFSPIWHCDKIEGQLFDIKKRVKQSKCVFIATIPTFLHQNINFNLYFDFVFNLNSYAFTNYFPNYDGIFEIEKAVEIGKIRENRLETNKFGFLSNRGGLSIQKICIPPEENIETGCSFTNNF